MIEAFLFGWIGWPIGMLVNGLANALPRRRVVPLWEDGGGLPSAWIRAVRTGAFPRRRDLIVELGVPILWGLTAARFGLSTRAGLVALYLTVLVLVTVTDLERRRIYDAVMLPAMALAAILAPVSPWLGAGPVGAWLMGLGAFVFFFLMAMLTRGGIGGGDATLAAFIGLTTGFPQGLHALAYGILIAGGVSLFLLLTRRATLKTAIPYGPFLALGGAIGLLGWITS
ncbi:prepilin peptidase [Thermoflexus sp.]|uniref:prepilin peptidase n=1 Tax=Thermoflexus sp. TaxID=1969742 RepID=UPI0035E3FC8F